MNVESREGPIYVSADEDAAEIYPYTRVTNPKKPDWSEAPEWANALGICDMDCYYYYGEWCWLSGKTIATTYGFSRIELRPT